MNERDIAKYAAMVIAGSIVEDELMELLGEESIVNEIMAVVGAASLVGASSNLIESAVDTTFDVAEDVIDTINPFNW